MNRSLKNIIMVVIIIIAVVCSYFTMKNASQVSSNTMIAGETPNNEQMMAKPDGDTNSVAPNGQNGPGANGGGMQSQGEEPPEKPDGDTNSTTPNGQNDPGANGGGMQSQGEEPPEKPDGDTNSTISNGQNDLGANGGEMQSQGEEPPEKPDGDTNSTTPNEQNAPGTNGGEMQSQGEGQPSMPNENGMNNSQSIGTTTYVLFAVEAAVVSLLLIYLIISKFNAKTFKEVMEKSGKIIYVILVIILTVLLVFLQIYLTNKFFMNNMPNNQMPELQNNNSSSADIAYSATQEITSEESLTSGTYTATDSDTSVILVSDGGNLTLSDSTITKESGDSSNTENSEFYGVNSGILVTKDSTATISNATISTNAKGSNAVFSTGENSKIYISDSTITTTGESSARGLDATYSGYIEADNVTITTQGGSCATLATDRGEGTVSASNSKLETNGTGSPVIYSTGNISIDNSEGTANSSQMVVIEGKNSATVKSSKLSATGKGNRGDTDQAGIMIYQSMSGDASVGTGEFTSENSTLSVMETSDYYKTAPMFFITNTDAVVNLTNTELNYGSNILISCKGTDEWGTSGQNGGNLEFNATNQTLTGNIEIDNISTLKMNLTSSTYEGTINADNIAQEISLELDANSKITLTGDSYVTSLEDTDSSYSNIDFNGYKLYVNGSAIN